MDAHRNRRQFNITVAKTGFASGGVILLCRDSQGKLGALCFY